MILHFFYLTFSAMMLMSVFVKFATSWAAVAFIFALKNSIYE